MVHVDIAPWLESLPVAPVFRPTEEEFEDPIAYILKIEKEAAKYGICKIVPPYSRAPESTVLSNLNASLAAIQEAGSRGPLARSMCSAVGESGGDARVVMPQSPVNSPAKFTTRRQQLGWNPKRPRGGSQHRAQKLVWESGEYYTLEQFEEKAKEFSSTLLGTSAELDPLVLETLFWNAECSKSIDIEYANDIPGSAFPAEVTSSDADAGDGLKLARSGWNVRNIARAQGSLLKFLPDDVPGVTTPMVYMGMLFSWFAWHVEDHELHSLNYLHTGARKTWYAVPADASSALEEVIRLYGYGNRLKPRVAFTLLGEKTTVLSPEVLDIAGVPCCRLVQNPGDYVITFPRAYHLGFSHGFNCGEAANFATPAWLGVAREAAVRRAAMNHLPMLSHEQLLYRFTMSLSKTSMDGIKRSQEVEDAVKSVFVKEVKQSNITISRLRQIGVEACIFLRDNRKPAPVLTEVAGHQNEETHTIPSEGVGTGEAPNQIDGKPPTAKEDGTRDDSSIAPFPTPWGALPCAACGILCFAGMALVQPASTSTLSSRQCKQKMHTAKQLGCPPRASGICQLNEEPDDVLPETSSLSDDSTPDNEPGGTQARVPNQSSLELLAEAYKEDSEEEREHHGRPDGTIIVGENSRKGNDGLEKSDAAGSQVGASVCSFNCESSNDLEQDEDKHPGMKEGNQLCVNNEAPPLDPDVVKTIGPWNFSRGSARPYVFCLEHALEAVTQLQSLGGATVLVICHPNHNAIQEKAEELAEEMNLSYTWEQIPVREAAETDVEIVTKAILLKVDNTLGWNWSARMGIGSKKSRKHAAQAKLGLENGKESAEAGIDKDPVLGSWCGKQWTATQVHPSLGGRKSSTQLLGQMLRKCELQKPMKMSSSTSGLTMEKKLRREGWNAQERVLTAAILRKSKRNALKTVREGRRKKTKCNGSEQQHSCGLQHCRQAVFALECDSNEATCQTSFNPATSSTTCQRNSNLQSDVGSVKWHDVPVLQSSMQEWRERMVEPPAICSVSVQDTGFDDMQSWDTVDRKLVVRLKRKVSEPQALLLSKKARIECVENSNEPDNLAKYSPESYSGLCEASAIDYTDDIDQSEEEYEEGLVNSDGGESLDDCCVKTGSGSDSSAPKALFSFAASRKRSSSKSRVKRATWENLLNRLTVPHKDEEVAVLQNQDFSCVTETGWDGFEYGTYGKLAAGGKQKRLPAPKRGKAAVQEDVDDANNPYPCDIEGCTMSFCSEQELLLHKKNKCTYKGCGKKFFSHKYLVQHRRVHMDDRPLKCPWEGCTMSFKWAWARTEHIRVHTGERPYSCPECDKTFRFVSDFSRHKRNTGHAKGSS